MATDGRLLKEMLRIDFGYEVDLLGGIGGSRETPWIVGSATPTEANKTELLTLTGLFRGQKVFWKLLETNVIDVDGRPTIQRKLETRLFKEEEIETIWMNYYFHRANTDPPNPSLPSPDIAHLDSRASLIFETQIGWLHFDNKYTYEDQDPSFGYVLHYLAPEIKASVYVYPIGDRSGDPVDEVRTAQRELEAVNGGAYASHDWDGRLKVGDDYALYVYIPVNSENMLSTINVIRFGSHFMKVRITHVDGVEFRDMISEFMNQLLMMCRYSNPANRS
jgi:hypothetical protein